MFLTRLNFAWLVVEIIHLGLRGFLYQIGVKQGNLTLPCPAELSAPGA